MPSECDIEFDHPDAVYYSGQNLNGSIKLTTTSSKTVRGVHITINGYAKVKWNERKSRSRNGKTEYYTVTYTAHDQYLYSRTYVFGGEGGSSFELPPGIQNHTFYCALPQTLPTSVTGSYGEIRYEVIVTVDRPYRFDNVFKSGFTVIQALDLNLDPMYRMPKSTVDDKEFCCTFCCCGGGGTVNTQLTLPFSGYAPGQKIKFSLLVSNESSQDLELCKIHLEKCITFEARSPSVKHKYSTAKLDTKRFPAVIRNSRKNFEAELLIPSVPPSSVLSSSCVRISYSVDATVVTGCCHNNISLSIPITIGTVPLIESATNPLNVIIQQPTAPTTFDQRSGDEETPPPGYKIAAPPSYEEAMTTLDKFVDDERDDKHQEAPFVPKYPVYHNFAQPSTSSARNGGQSSSSNVENQSSTLTYGWNTSDN